MQVFSDTLSTLDFCGDDLVVTDGLPFDRVAYSRFKYGYTPPAIGYGLKLADLIIDQLLEHGAGHPTIVVSAPYKFVPTASHSIALAIRQALAVRLVSEGIEPPVVVPFHKSRAGTDSYANGNLEDRQRSLETLGLSIDERLVQDANVVVVDDIRITGSAEASTAAFIERLNPRGVWYLHAARLTSQAAAHHPGVESELNQTFCKDYSTILRDVLANEFRLNARVLGFMMKALDPEAFEWFLGVAPLGLLEQMYESTICTSLAYIARFPTSLCLLKAALESRGSQIAMLPSVAVV